VASVAAVVGVCKSWRSCRTSVVVRVVVGGGACVMWGGGFFVSVFWWSGYGG
jgi:hypothetical protein